MHIQDIKRHILYLILVHIQDIKQHILYLFFVHIQDIKDNYTWALNHNDHEFVSWVYIYARGCGNNWKEILSFFVEDSCLRIDY